MLEPTQFSSGCLVSSSVMNRESLETSALLLLSIQALKQNPQGPPTETQMKGFLHSSI